MSQATFSLPHHVFPSPTSRARHMNNPSAQAFSGYHTTSSNQSQSTNLLSSAAPGVQRTLPYLLAGRGSSSSSYASRKYYNPGGYSSSSSAPLFSTKSRGSSSTRMAAPAAGNQLQAGQVCGSGATSAAGVMHRKSRATCTLSLAHVSASAFRPSVSTSTSSAGAAVTSDSGSDDGSSVVNEDRMDQAQTQALKDAVGDAPVHMLVGADGHFPRIEVEADIPERMVFSEPEDVTPTTKAAPITIPSRLPIRSKKSFRSFSAKQKQSEVNIIPFPSSEVSLSSFSGYMSDRQTYTRERSGSISSAYSSTSSRSYSSSSSSGSFTDTSATSSSSSSPPHALMRTSPPLSFKVLPRRSRRSSNASMESVQQPSPGVLSINTSTAAGSSSNGASAVVDDRDPPSPSSATSAASSCTLAESDDASDSTPVSPVKNDLKAKSTLALTMESTPPPPPYSLLPPPYSPLSSLGKGADAKQSIEAVVQPPRSRRPLPEPPAQIPSVVPVTEVVSAPAADESPVVAEVSVIHAPVPRAAFVRVEEANEVPNAVGAGDKITRQPGGSEVSLPPISPPAQPPRVRTTSRTTTSGSAGSSKSASVTTRHSRISTGELKVLLYLYRTVVFGLESRYRLESERSPSPSLMDQKTTSTRFPLVEEDDDASKYTHTPHSSPSTSPAAPSHFPEARFNPSSCACPSPSPTPGSCRSPSTQAFQEARERAKAKQAADNAMDVQDALLAIRLRGLLRSQGVPESDLDLRVHNDAQSGEDKDPRSNIVVEDDGGAEDLDPFAEFGVTELDSASDSSDAGRSSLPARPLKASPPPLARSTSGSSAKTGIAPSAAYMIALLTMRYRYASPSRRSRLPSPRKNGAHAGGRKSKLNVAAWVANPDGGIVEEEEVDFDSCSVVDWYM